MNNEILLLILKAKRRQIGETWTRPSGITVKKIAKNKIIPVPKGRIKKAKDDPSKGKKAKDDPSKGKKKGFYTTYSKFLDRVKKITGIGRSDVIQKNIESEYEQAKLDGIQTKGQKFLFSYLEYFAHKSKWDKLFSEKNKAKLMPFINNGKEISSMKDVREIISSKKKFRGKNKLYDKKSMHYLFEKYGIKESGALEVGQKIDLDRETRFNDYKIGSTQLLTGRQENTQLPTMNYLSGALQNQLVPHQQDGANLCMEKFHSGETGFVLADGTGGGKTRQALAVAMSYLQTMDTAKPVIICTESDNILNTAWMEDARAMGIEINNAKKNGFQPGKINITTYSQAEKIQNIENLGLLIFDESHNLKNIDSNQTEFAMNAMKKASHVLNCSATPVEAVEHIAYLAESLGMDSKEVIKYINGNKGSSSFDKALRMDSFFEDLTKKGLMVKREVSLTNLDLEINHTIFDKVTDDLITELENRYKSSRGSANELMALRRVLEEKKIDEAMNHLERELKEGRQVVLFADRISDTELYGHKSKGTLPEIERRLEKLGIKFESIYGGANKDNVERKNRFQSGESKVIIGNADSMGTGISLDDTVGNAPRTIINLTPPFSAMTFLQVLGRINRLSTKSKAKAIMLSSDHYSDQWGMGILRNKAETLGASVKGDYETIDLENGGSPTVGKKSNPPPVETNNFRRKSNPPPVENEETTTVKSELYYLVLKAKKLPQGHVTTRKDGSQWVKKKDEKGGKANWVMVKKPTKKKPAKKKTPSKKKKVKKPSKKKVKKEKKPENILSIEDFAKRLPTVDSNNMIVSSYVGKFGFDDNIPTIIRENLKERSINPTKNEDWEITVTDNSVKLQNKKDKNDYYEFNKEDLTITDEKDHIKLSNVTSDMGFHVVNIFLKDQPIIETTEKIKEVIKKTKEQNKYYLTQEQIEDMRSGEKSGVDTLGKYLMGLFYRPDGNLSGIVKKTVYNKDEDDVQDIVSDTMLATLENYNRGIFYHMEAKAINAYILATLRNKAMSFNNVKDNQSISIDSIDGESDIFTDNKTVESNFIKKEEESEQVKIDKERIKEVKNIVKDSKESKLKFRNEKIWELYTESRLNGGRASYRKIADELGITSETVKQQIKNIKKRQRNKTKIQTTVKSELYYLVLKAKKLPQGHVTTRKDGSQWVKKKDEKGGKANWVLIKKEKDSLTLKTIKGAKNIPDFPPEFIKKMKKWDIVRRSPYSNSFYNTADKSWDHTPNGSLRISDHWNFYSQGQTHCHTDKKPPDFSWTIARYSGEKKVYEVIESFSKDEIREKKESLEIIVKRNKILSKAEKILGTKEYSIISPKGIMKTIPNISTYSYGEYLFVKNADIDKVREYFIEDLKILSKNDVLNLGDDNSKRTEHLDSLGYEPERIQYASKLAKLANLTKQGLTEILEEEFENMVLPKWEWDDDYEDWETTDGSPTYDKYFPALSNNEIISTAKKELQKRIKDGRLDIKNLIFEDDFKKLFTNLDFNKIKYDPIAKHEEVLRYVTSIDDITELGYFGIKELRDSINHLFEIKFEDLKERIEKAIKKIDKIKHESYKEKEKFLANKRPIAIHSIKGHKHNYYYFYDFKNISFHSPVKDNDIVFEDIENDSVETIKGKFKVKKIEMKPDNWDSEEGLADRIRMDIEVKVVNNLFPKWYKNMGLEHILESAEARQYRYDQKKRDYEERKYDYD